MSITNVEVNFSTNASPHSATITEIIGSSVGPEMLSTEIGEAPNLSNDEISDFLGDFILDSVTTKKDARTDKREYRYIDRLSAKIDSYVLVVRGLNAPPNRSTEYDGKIFPSSELPDSFFGEGEYTNSGERNSYTNGGIHGSNTYSICGKAIIIGTTYSVISSQFENSRVYNVYNSGEKIDDLSYGNPVNPEQSESIQDPSSASLKFGYTSKDFFAALDAIGVDVSGAPRLTNHLFESNGKLRDCISAIASFYGYYWYINNSTVIFVSSQEANSRVISNPPAGEDVLSTSFTESTRPPLLIETFFGTTAPQKNDFNRGGSGSGLGGERLTAKRFKRYPVENIFKLKGLEDFTTQDCVSYFSKFFHSEKSESALDFDRYFYGVYVNFYSDFKDKTSFPNNDFMLEGDEPKKYRLTNIFGDQQGQTDPVKVGLAGARGAWTTQGADKKNILGYRLSDVSGRIEHDIPSSSEFYKFVSTFYAFWGRLFVSNGYEENFIKKRTFVSTNGLSVSGPFLGTKLISEIPELQELASLYAFATDRDFTVYNLAIAAGVNELAVNDAIEDNIDPRDVLGQKYFYFATVTEKNILPAKYNAKEKDNITKDREFDFLDRIAFSLDLNGKTYVIAKDKLFDGCKSIADTSRAIVRVALGQKVENQELLPIEDLQETVKVPFTKYVDENPNVSVGSSSGNPEAPESLPFEYLYSKVVCKSAENYVKTSLASYNGSAGEAKFLASYINLTPAANPENSSTETIYALSLPTLDITIDSVSIAFSDDGITTTISKSNKSIIPKDQSLIIADGFRAHSINNIDPRFGAGPKNLFGIH